MPDLVAKAAPVSAPEELRQSLDAGRRVIQRCLGIDLSEQGRENLFAEHVDRFADAFEGRPSHTT